MIAEMWRRLGPRSREKEDLCGLNFETLGFQECVSNWVPGAFQIFKTLFNLVCIRCLYIKL